MIGEFRRRLRRRGDREAPAPEPASPAVAPGPPPTEIEFAAYAEDSRIFGFIMLDAHRLSDALNDQSEYRLTDVMVAALADGTATEAKWLVVPRDTVLAVRAAGPRGNPELRGRTRPFPVTLQAGPYTIHGHLHALPGADPLQQLRRRKTMVPLTEAWIEYVADGQPHRARVGTIIVNRETLDWIRQSKDQEVGVPDLPVETAIDPRAKDMTGYIHTEAE